MTPLVEIKELNKHYGKLQALNHVNLTLEKGHIIGLLGPNGSGKTTLLKAMNGLLETKGTLLIDGNAPGTKTKAIVSYLPERTYFNEKMTVNKIIEFFRDFYADFDEGKARALLKELQIDENAKLKHLSKGTKEKVQLILVLSRKAKLYLLDEPIGGVDPAARDVILDLILKMYDPESTVVISTHLITDVERIFDEVFFLKEGTIVTHGDADAMREEHNKSIDELFREVFQCSINC